MSPSSPASSPSPASSRPPRVPREAIDHLFERGFAAFQLPAELVRRRARRRLAGIAEFLGGDAEGWMCLDLRGGGADEAGVRWVRRWLRAHPSARRVGEVEHESAEGLFRVGGSYATLRALKEAVFEAGVALRQIWYSPGSPSAKMEDPLAALLRELFEQIYPRLTPEEYGHALVEGGRQVQLYDEGCFITEHQDAREDMGERRGIYRGKRCIMLCYLNEDWRAGDGGEIDCVLDVRRDDRHRQGSGRGRWADHEHLIVPPRLGNIGVLEFTRFNDPHTVRPVTRAGFVRKMFGWDFTVSVAPIP